VGEKTIGLAITDALGMAQPLYTLTREGRSRDLAKLREIVTQYGVEQIVIGLPLNMDGSSGPATARATFFARWLREALQVPTALVDERLSTVEAEDRLRAAHVPPAQWPDRLDAVAAAVILEEYLRRGVEGSEGDLGQKPREQR